LGLQPKKGRLFFRVFHEKEIIMRQQAFFSFMLMLFIVFFFPYDLIADRASSKQLNRIVGGTVSMDNQWPWMLGLVTNKDSGPLCGAALIHPKWAITAAHCTEVKDGGVVSANYYHVVSGIFDFRQDYQAHMHAIKRVISHPDYNSVTIDNDIALLELTSEISGIPILDIYTGDISSLNGVALGWGRIASYGSFSDQLREVTMPVVPFQTCVESTRYTVTKNMFCAGYPKGGKDACEGDSGGPFVIYNDHHWQLAGIVSWGEDCAMPNKYGFYTKVPNYYSYILSYVPLHDSFSQADINHDCKIDLQDVMIVFDYISKDDSKE
jgi:secreted trypsin-like serine protease